MSTLEEIEFPQFYYQRDASDEKEDHEIIAAETKNELDKEDHSKENKANQEILKPDHDDF